MTRTSPTELEKEEGGKGTGFIFQVCAALLHRAYVIERVSLKKESISWL